MHIHQTYLIFCIMKQESKHDSCHTIIMFMLFVQLYKIYLWVCDTRVLKNQHKHDYYVGVATERIRQWTHTRKVVGSNPGHGTEKLGKFSCKPLPHPTQV